MSINLGRVVVVCALAVSLSPAGSGAVLDAYDDFTSSNPSGPWSYGYTPTLNGVFNTFTDFYAAPAPGAFGHEAAWREESVDTYLGLYKTSSPGLLLSHPGTAGQFAVLRFTAPSAGDYTVSSAFSGIDAATTTCMPTEFQFSPARSTDSATQRHSVSSFRCLRDRL